MAFLARRRHQMKDVGFFDLVVVNPGGQWLKPTRLDHSFALTLRFCAESRCSPERSDGFEAGQIRWPHRIEVGFGQRRLSFLRASLVI